MKRLNIKQLKQLAKDNGSPLFPVLLTGIIQTYFGGLERVLQFLMVNVVAVFLFGTWAIISSSIPFLPALASWWAFATFCAVAFASMYLEFLYCSKDSSFLTTVTGLSRLFCPDKNADHRHEELRNTIDQVDEVKAS